MTKSINHFAILIILFVMILLTDVSGQSTLQDFPTPVSNSEIRGTISARPIGDSRLTTHYYLFDGKQGDIFINLITSNFVGDIDIFIQQGLRPITKMVLYADNPVNETGRVIYLRKEERLLLRVQGRTPDDDPASYQIKFAGSFVAINKEDVQQTPDLPVVSSTASAENVTADKPEIAIAKERETPPIEQRTTRSESADLLRKDSLRRTQPPPPVVEKTPVNRTPPVSRRETVSQPDANPGFELVVEFKDGGKINRSMTDVQRFTVDGGILTVIYKSGSIGRYPMSTVVRVGIEQAN